MSSSPVVRTVGTLMDRLHLREPLLRALSPRRRAEHRLTGEIVADIHALGFGEVLRLYTENAEARRSDYHHDGAQNSLKYLKLDWTVATAVHEANRLNLFDVPPLRILDIGCGVGVFLYALRRAGHDVIGLDIDTYPVFDDMIRLLQVPRITHRIERFQPLPDFGAPLDLITAYSVCFDDHSGPNVWREREWTYFIDDCKSRLAPKGRICLNFNPATQQTFDFIPDEVAAMMRAMPGATLSANKEVLLIQT